MPQTANAKSTLPQPVAPGVHPRLFWSIRPRTDRQSGDAIVSNFLLHWLPAKTYKPSMDWSYSMWLGTVSAALLLLLVLSGAPLLFLYVPSVERAYASIKDIEFAVTFGSWIRSIHRMAAHLMVAAVFLHLVRVFLTGAYKNGIGQGQQREWNWLIGVAMLLLTLLLSFTGYLLPWSFIVNGAFIGGVLLPGLLVTALAAWPWLDRTPVAAAGVWFPRTRRAQNAVFLFVVAIVVAFTLIGTFCRGPYWNFYWPWQGWPEIPTRL